MAPHAMTPRPGALAGFFLALATVALGQECQSAFDCEPGSYVCQDVSSNMILGPGEECGNGTYCECVPDFTSCWDASSCNSGEVCVDSYDNTVLTADMYCDNECMCLPESEVTAVTRCDSGSTCPSNLVCVHPDEARILGFNELCPQGVECTCLEKSGTCASGSSCPPGQSCMDTMDRPVGYNETCPEGYTCYCQEDVQYGGPCSSGASCPQGQSCWNPMANRAMGYQELCPEGAMCNCQQDVQYGGPCSSGASCPQGQSCWHPWENRAMGYDEMCPEGASCMCMEVQGHLQNTGCPNGASCPLGESCLDMSRLRALGLDDRCPAGSVCGCIGEPNMTEVPECAIGSECVAGQMCIYLWEERPLKREEQCPQGAACICMASPGCASGSKCQDGQVCVDASSGAVLGMDQACPASSVAGCRCEVPSPTTTTVTTATRASTVGSTTTTRPKVASPAGGTSTSTTTKSATSTSTTTTTKTQTRTTTTSTTITTTTTQVVLRSLFCENNTGLPQRFPTPCVAAEAKAVGVECVVGCPPGTQGADRIWTCRKVNNSFARFNGTNATCTPIACGVVGSVMGVNASRCVGLGAFDTCTVSCNRGFSTTQAPETLTCSAIGMWSTPRLKCDPMRCLPPQELQVASLNHDCVAKVHGERCSVSCSAGYVMEGLPAQLQCDAGTFRSAVAGGPLTPRCVPAVCNRNMPHGYGVDPTPCIGTTTGGRCDAGCLVGFLPILGRSPTVECLPSGEFSESTFSCAPVRCGNISQVSSFSLSSLEHDCRDKELNQVCSVGCAQGYDFASGASWLALTCSPRGDYVAIGGKPLVPPACVPAPCDPEEIKSGTRADVSGCEALVVGQSCAVFPKPGNELVVQTVSFADSTVVAGSYSSMRAAMDANPNTVLSFKDPSVPFDCKPAKGGRGSGAGAKFYYSGARQNYIQYTAVQKECSIAQSVLPANTAYFCAGKDKCYVYCLAGFTGTPKNYKCNPELAVFVPATDPTVCVPRKRRLALGAEAECSAAMDALLAGQAYKYSTNCGRSQGSDVCAVACALGYNNAAGNDLPAVFGCSAGQLVSLGEADEGFPVLPTCVLSGCVDGLPAGDGVQHDCSGKAMLETCTATCAPGYTPAPGSKATETFTCRADGSFDGTSPTCVPSMCGPLALTSEYNAESCEGAAIGQECTVLCEQGYSSVYSEKSVLRCEANGNFSGALPVCRPNMCVDHNPPDADLVAVGCSGLTTGQACMARCAEGHEGHAEVQRCSTTGVVTGARPHCVAKLCPDLPQVEGIVHTCASVPFGGMCFSSCSQGYAAAAGGVAMTTWTCGKSTSGALRLQGQAPTCKPKRCIFNLPVGPGYLHTCGGVTTGESCTVQCAKGYIAQGHGGVRTRTCGETGELLEDPTADPLTCVALTCSAPASRGVSSNCAGKRINETCHATCAAGFEYVGDAARAELSCALDPSTPVRAALVGAAPQCQRKRCDLGLIDQDKYDHDCFDVETGSECTVRCAGDLVGEPQVLECSTSGSFGGMLPRCTFAGDAASPPTTVAHEVAATPPSVNAPTVAYRVAGRLSLSVRSEAAGDFAGDIGAIATLRRGLAALANVPEAYVRVGLSASYWFNGSPQGRGSAAGEFTIVVPSLDVALATPSMMGAIAKTLGDSTATSRALNVAIAAEPALARYDAIVETVDSVRTSVPTDTPPAAGPEDYSGLAGVDVWYVCGVGAAVGVPLACFLLFVWYTWGRYSLSSARSAASLFLPRGAVQPAPWAEPVQKVAKAKRASQYEADAFKPYGEGEVVFVKAHEADEWKPAVVTDADKMLVQLSHGVGKAEEPKSWPIVSRAVPPTNAGAVDGVRSSRRGRGWAELHGESFDDVVSTSVR